MKKIKKLIKKYPFLNGLNSNLAERASLINEEELLINVKLPDGTDLWSLHNECTFAEGNWSEVIKKMIKYYKYSVAKKETPEYLRNIIKDIYESSKTYEYQDGELWAIKELIK